MPIRKVSFENPHFTGTEAAKMPEGTNAQRANAVSGDQRFNTDTTLMEYYDGTTWKPIDSPPAVSSISPTTVDEADATTSITVTGDRFGTGASVTAIGQDGSTVSANSTTRNSSTSLTAVFTSSNFDNAQEPYTIKVLNQSGLSAQLGDALQINASPVWSSAAAPTSLGDVQDTSTGTALTLSASDSEGATVTYAETTSNLTTYGLTLNSDGTISGTVTDQTADTNVTFTGTASDGDNTVSRNFAFNILKTYDGTSSDRALQTVADGDSFVTSGQAYWLKTGASTTRQLYFYKWNNYAYALVGSRYQSSSNQTSVNTNSAVGTTSGGNNGTTTFKLSIAEINYTINELGLMLLPQQASGALNTSNDDVNLFRGSNTVKTLPTDIFTNAHDGEGVNGTSVRGTNLSSLTPSSYPTNNWYDLDSNSHEGGNQILSYFGNTNSLANGGVEPLGFRFSNGNGAGYNDGAARAGNDVTGSARNLSNAIIISLFMLTR